MEYTKGPWTPGAGNVIDMDILGVWAGDYRVVAICGKQKAEDEKESIANCYLIAAAPDLLEALKILDNRGGLGLDVHEWIRGIIAKAEGVAK